MNFKNKFVIKSKNKTPGKSDAIVDGNSQIQADGNDESIKATQNQEIVSNANISGGANGDDSTFSGVGDIAADKPNPFYHPINLETLQNQYQDNASWHIYHPKVMIDADNAQEHLPERVVLLDQRRFGFLINKMSVEHSNNSYNGKIDIMLSSNKMVAWMFMLPPIDDGEHVTMDEVSKVIEAYNIQDYVDWDKLNKFIAKRRYLQVLQIATGTMPTKGDDGYLVKHFLTEGEASEIEDSNRSVDYKNKYIFNSIKKDQVICDIVSPTIGEEGINLNGDILPGIEGAIVKVPNGKNTYINDENTMLLASIDGDLVFRSSEYQVRNVLRVLSDVDYSFGNIDFNGDVHINGNVREGFFVRASGDINIGGVVEAAVVDAGGDVTVMGGIAGNGILKCRGELRTKFMESCTVFVAQSIYSTIIMNSNIYCDQDLIVTEEKGSIMGGRVYVRNRAEAKVLGSSRYETPTILNLGVPKCGGEKTTVFDDEKSLYNDMERQHEEIEQIKSTRGRFGEICPGVLINIGPYHKRVDNEYLNATIRYSEMEDSIIIE